MIDGKGKRIVEDTDVRFPYIDIYHYVLDSGI